MWKEKQPTMKIRESLNEQNVNIQLTDTIWGERPTRCYTI